MRPTNDVIIYETDFNIVVRDWVRAIMKGDMKILIIVLTGFHYSALYNGMMNDRQTFITDLARKLILENPDKD